MTWLPAGLTPRSPFLAGTPLCLQVAEGPGGGGTTAQLGPVAILVSLSSHTFYVFLCCFCWLIWVFIRNTYYLYYIKVVKIPPWRGAGVYTFTLEFLGDSDK